MYSKRLKAYKRIGYQLSDAMCSEKQIVNSIFDADNYIDVYETDLRKATKEIVISSPTLSRTKVIRLLQLIGPIQEQGVQISIVTWHPDSYKYGKDEHRLELMELMRNSGIHIELTGESCEHYAVIDNKTVWYGSINLLSKEDADDNIMRIESPGIAAELLEMSFGKESEAKEFQIPLCLLFNENQYDTQFFKPLG